MREESESRSIDIIVLLLLCPLLLAGCLNAPFLKYDDADHVALPVVRGLQAWWHAFLPDYGTCYPLTILSFRAEVLFFRGFLDIANWAPFARIDNLILHAIAGFSVWLMCRALRVGRAATVLATGAFLLHPLACESVCWVSERKNTLAAAFGFGALAVQMCVAQKNWRTPLAAALFALSVWSKPASVGLLPVMLALDLEIVRHSIGLPLLIEQPKRVQYCGWFVMTLAALGSSAFAIYAHREGLMPPPGGSVYTALLADAEILRRYIHNLLWPSELSIAYGVMPITSAFDPRFLVNAGFVAAFVAGTTILSPRRNLSAFLWFWFFVALAPVMNLISITIVMQDRFLYFSTPAFFLIVALAIQGLAARLKSLRGSLALPLAWGAVAVFCLFSVFRSALWSDVSALFGDAAEKQPDSVWAQLDYGYYLSKAASQYELHPPDDLSDEERNRRIDALRTAAVTHLELATQCGDFVRVPAPGVPYGLLGLVQLKRGQLDAAEAAVRTILADRFTRPQAPSMLLIGHDGLAAVLLARHRPLDALHETQAAIALGDTPVAQSPAWFLTGRACEDIGRVPEAVEAYGKVSAEAEEYPGAQARIAELKRK